tara:strand:- start:178 stop:909 length:732 start_codon:yes stop_codon:yes gene_type:complete
MSPFIEREARLYTQGDRVLYETETFGVSVLTDTTERAPTFSLSIFESYEDGETSEPLSLCYLRLPSAATVESAWNRLLKRDPRCLEWPTDLPVTRREHLMRYDISAQAEGNRQRSCGQAGLHRFRIEETAGAITWSFGELEATAIPAGIPMLERQILLKMLLNAHSTLVMGRLGRYEGNLMTYVKPSNNKLIDRSIRYVQTLFRCSVGGELDYTAVCEELFRQREQLAPDEPIVLKTLAALRS